MQIILKRVIFIIMQPSCPMIERRPQNAVSTFQMCLSCACSRLIRLSAALSSSRSAFRKRYSVGQLYCGHADGSLLNVDLTISPFFH